MRKLEIDILKGGALILMVTFHIFFLMYYMNVSKYNIHSGILNFIAKISHTTFIITAGVNMYLNYQKNQKNMKKFIFRQNKRVLKIFIGALVISILSQKSFGNKLYVKFGILHFMATSIILSYPIVSSKELSFLIFLFITLFSVYLDDNSNDFNWMCNNNPFLCFILGIYGPYNYNYTSLDHFPIIPKFGQFALGISMGHILYGNNKEYLKINDIKDNKFIKILRYFGTNTFFIYMIHFPIIYFVLYLLGGRPVTSF